MSDKDDILDKINALKDSLASQRVRYEEKQREVKEAEKLKESLEAAFNELRVKLTDAREITNVKKWDLQQITVKGISEKSELARLERQLSRLLDAEQINEAYSREIEAFKDKCLEAPWRAENRSDGIGALPHQIEGAIHLAVAKQALLGDKRGLGKTLTSLIYCDFVEAKRVVVICPGDTMDNFIQEVKMWTPHRNVIKLGKMPKMAREFLLANLKEAAQYTLVINYEAWRRDGEYITDLIALNADTLIFDEAHHAKTSDTITCKGIHNLRFGLNVCPSCEDASDIRQYSSGPQLVNKAKCMSCEYEAPVIEFCSIKNVLPMTGTFILNRPQELWPHLKLIDPNNFWRESSFLMDFCKQNNNRHWTWQYGAEKSLMDKIGPRYLARDRATAGVVIPESKPITHLITMDDMKERYPSQYRAYEQVRDYAQLVLDPANEIVMSMPYKIVAIMRMRQVVTWPAAIELKAYDKDLKEVKTVAKLDVHESIKLDKAEEIIRELWDEDERVVLFSQFKDPLRILQQRLGVRSVVLDGSTSQSIRNQIRLDFDPKTVSESPQWDAVLCNYKTAGEGLNFHAARHLIILDEEWNPGKQEQAYGRVDRLGQTKESTIHTIRVEGSIDTWMADLIDEKRDLISGFETEADLFQMLYQAIRDGKM